MWWSSAVPALLSAFVLVAVLTPMSAELLVRLSIVDVEGERSSHAGTVPRGGGVVVLLAALVSGAVATLTGEVPRWSVSAVALVVVAVLLGVVGGVDDRRSLSARSRLLLQVALAACASLLVLADHPVGLAVATFVGLVGFVNAFNFMDGINGISALTAAVIAASTMHVAWGQDGPVVLAAAALVGASLGFFVHNGRGRIFLGDVGSYFLGAALVALAVLAWADGGSAVVLAVPFVPYIADVAATLVRRLRRGADVLRPHREHTYQRLASGRWTHVETSAFYAGMAAVLSVAARFDSSLGLALALVAAGGIAVAGSRLAEAAA